MHPEHPAGVASGGARFAPEAGGEGDPPEGHRVQDLVRVQRSQRHFGRADQKQSVTLDAVDVDRVGGEEAGTVHRFFAHEHGRQNGEVALARQHVDREPIEGHFQEREIAHPVHEARPGHFRSALGVDPSVGDGGAYPRRS